MLLSVQEVVNVPPSCCVAVNVLVVSPVTFNAVMLLSYAVLDSAEPPPDQVTVPPTDKLFDVGLNVKLESPATFPVLVQYVT